MIGVPRESGARFDYDAEIAPHNRLFRAAAAAGPDDRVLDIGCGTGQSTREAAAVAGSVLGVDVSGPALEDARRLSEGLRNVAHLQADAASYLFPPAHFDLCISRFGVMFFADPVAAFANIAAALRPAARLVLLVWQDQARNEWSTAVEEAIVGGPAPFPPGRGPDPFSLGDPATAEHILTEAGFTDVAFTAVEEPVYYGPDVAAAFDAVLRLRRPQELLATKEAETGRARERLRATLAAHHTGDGVYFGSRAWIVTARRAATSGSRGKA